MESGNRFRFRLTFRGIILEARTPNRESLFAEYRLTPGVLFTIVSRAAYQKGLHLITEHIDELIDAGARFIWLTNGERDIMQTIESCAANILIHVASFQDLTPALLGDYTAARILSSSPPFTSPVDSPK